MSEIGTYLAIYDITSNRERQLVAKVLQGFGFRVQKSAFELKLLKAGKHRLIRQLEALEIETGTILIYHLNAGAVRRAVGLPPDPGLDQGYAFVI